MSGTDDTEELLRAAPLDPRLGAGLVSGLASQLDSVKARLANLESVSFSESVVSAREYFRFANSPNKTQRTPVKYGNAHNSDKFHTIPKRYRKNGRANKSQFSPAALFKTETNSFKKKSPDSKRNRLRHLNVQDSLVSDVEKLSDFSKDSFYSGDLSNMESDSCISLCSLEKKIDKTTLLEIDAFLNTMAKADGITNDWGLPGDGFIPLKEVGSNAGQTLRVGVSEPPDISSKYIGTKFYGNIDERQIKTDTYSFKDFECGSGIVKNLFQNNSNIPDPSNVTLSHKMADVDISDTKKDNTSVNICKESPIKKIIATLKDDNAIPKKAPSLNDADQRNNFGLPSLTELWSNASESKNANSFIDSQRLEEEKLRRKHCEDVIQQLQRKILEQQQKIAVALQVDATKDDVISKLKESCSKTENHYLVREDVYKKDFQHVNAQLKNAINLNNELKKDLDNYESRFEKMIKLLNDREEKYNKAIADKDDTKAKSESEIAELKSLLSEKDAKIAELNDARNLFVEMNKQITENYNTTHLNMEKIKNENVKLNEQSDNLRVRLKSLEDEIIDLHAKKSECLSRIADEKSQNSHLNGQKSKLQISLDAAYRQIDQLETEKCDLKISYQKQVNEIITKKASEFQTEFDNAQSQMAKQMREKEKEIALQFARHLNKIEQHQQFEISKLEQTQKQHIELYKIQLNKSAMIIRQLEEKLASYKERRGEIAAQLHNVMQCQWQQALKIITNADKNPQNRSDEESRPIKTDSIPTHDKVKNTKSLETNVEDVITDDRLQHYVKILLNKIPSISETPKPSDADDIEPKPKPKSLKFDPHSNKNLQEFEFPTSDKASENSDRKFSKKVPWK